MYMYVCVCVNITSSLSIHLLVDIGSFHVLAIVSNAAVNLGCMHLFELVFSFFFFPDTYPGVEFLGHVVALFLVF